MDIPRSIQAGGLWWTIETDPDLSETGDDHLMTGITLPQSSGSKSVAPEREHHEGVQTGLLRR